MKRWMVALSMLAAVASATLESARPLPLRLAIYYGYPSLAEGAGGNLDRAVSTFSPYDVVVFGDGLERPAAGSTDAGVRAERERIASIIGRLHQSERRPRIYGYIDLGSTQRLASDEIATRVALWQAPGADGVFFDEAGADFGVTPSRRHAAIGAVHARGMSAFMNAFRPDDLFDDDGAAGPAERLGPSDAILLESLAVRNGEREPVAQTAARIANAAAWRQRSGVQVFAITTAGAAPFNQRLLDAAWRMADAASLDGFGWGEPQFSADSRLPWRTRPEDPLTR